MKSKYLIFLIIIISLNITCKNPVEELKDFRLNMNGMLADPLIHISFETNDSTMPKPQNVIVRMSGEGAKYIYDINGKTDFSAETGVIDLILGPGIYPDNNTPLSFTVEASADNCVPLRQEIFIFSRNQKLDIKLKFNSNKNLSGDITYLKKDLNFLGKKGTDTISFDYTRNDGVKFIVKYPRAGLSFILKKNIKFKIGEQVRMEAEYRDDSVWVDYDTIQEPVRTIIGVQIYNGQVANEYKITGYKMIPTSTTKKRQVVVGYKIRDTIPVYETRTVIDTIPVSNVVANIYSMSTFLECGFFDETNNYIDKPRLFTGVVGLPQVNMVDKVSGAYVSAVYSGNNSGRIIECFLPGNQNYKIFASGIVNSANGDYYYSIKRAVNLEPNNNFVLQNDGKYKFSLKDNFIDGCFFIFKNSSIGCGFADIDISCPNVDFNYGFDVYAEVSSSIYNVSAMLKTPNAGFIRFPSFPGVNANVSLNIDHPDNRCKGGQALFREVRSVDLCNYINSKYVAEFAYNSTSYINSLPPFVPVQLTAMIQCTGGNFVLPPDITLKYRKIPCGSDYYGEVTLVDGKLNSNAFQKNQTYQIRYDRISSLGNPLTIYDTITFDSRAEQIIRDESTGYWEGKMKYDGSKFNIDFVFDNRKLKYDIRGCGN